MPTRLHRLVILLLLCPCFSLAQAGPRIETVSYFFESSDGVRLHYLDAGRGPTIVFVPGWTMPAEIWQSQIRHFAKSFRVIAFDPRGQGESAIARNGYTPERRARDISELLERLDQPVVLIGWSLGVLDTLEYVNLTGTAQLRALVLVDNSIGEEPPPSFDPTFLSRLRQNRIGTTERFVRGMYRTPQKESYLREIIARSLRMPLDASVALLSYPYAREHWKEIVYRVDRPLLYAVNPRFRGQAQNLKKNRPDAWIEVFEDAGHALFVDEAERFNRLLEDFLANAVQWQAAETKDKGR